MSDEKTGNFRKKPDYRFLFFLAGNGQIMSEVARKCPYYISGPCDTREVFLASGQNRR